MLRRHELRLQRFAIEGYVRCLFWIETEEYLFLSEAGKMADSNINKV
jgi:hypothetical protein